MNLIKTLLFDFPSPFTYVYWAKKRLPVHEFHMQFKILVYNSCILAQFVACSAVNVRDMSSRPATYSNNILFLHMVCAILTRQWFV